MVLKLYGFMVSQPTRSVAWVCKLKGLDYEFVKVNPNEGDANNDAFRALNPNGLVPVIQDDDFTLYEGAAILTYLAEKHGWTDVLPSDLHQRAKMNQYLHWHHTSARKATPQILVSHIFKVNGNATPAQLELIAKQEEIIGQFTSVIEKTLVGPFIAGTQTPTIADFMCYPELSQVESMGIFDFTKYPKVEAWLARMKQVPHHDEIQKDVNDLLETLHLKPVQP